MYISVLLMILAIIAIISFQLYWLISNYQEEKQTLRVQTNILFREAVYQCQARKLKLDTSLKFRQSSPRRVKVISNRLDHFHDSLRQNSLFNSKIIFRGLKQRFSESEDSAFIEIDSGKIRKFITTSPGSAKTFVEILETETALQDSITVPELTKEYHQMLSRENIRLPFTITKSQGAVKDEFIAPDLENANEVSIGFLNPVTFRVDVNNVTGYILRKLSPTLLLSLFLVGLTVMSFILLYRNLMRQRKLTQLKNDFISNITHELKTPIATVSVAIEALKNFNALDNPQRTQEYLNISANEMQRLSLMVDKVLRISLLEKKGIQLKKESFDIGQMTLHVLDSMKLQFEKQQATTSLKLTGQNFAIVADEKHLASVVYNLLDNALKYSKENPVIDVHIVDRTKFLELRVRDNGIGIAHEYREKIYEQFFRVPSGDQHNTKGYGLGLSYVNHIVRMHQGFIELDTEVGKGSTFIVKLPFAEASVIHYDKNRTVRKLSFRL